MEGGGWRGYHRVKWKRGGHYGGVGGGMGHWVGGGGGGGGGGGRRRGWREGGVSQGCVKVVCGVVSAHYAEV